ncbi:MAG: selenium cofactor biosynthesis protein YqeC [Desulfobacteraceae bacterium]
MERLLTRARLALGLGPRELVAVVGGGGKSTLLAVLVRELTVEGRVVLASTTTKVMLDQALAMGDLALTSERGWRERLRAALELQARAFLGGACVPPGKVEGIEPGLAEEVFSSGEVDYMLVEADGAAGRPLKVPEAHEPVIPQAATLVAAVIGVDALGHSMGPDNVFRMERFTAVTGLRPGDRITPRALVAAVFHPEGLFKGVPPGAGKTVFLNRLDLSPGEGPGREAAERILAECRPGEISVVLGSLLQGRFIRFFGE